MGEGGVESEVDGSSKVREVSLVLVVDIWAFLQPVRNSDLRTTRVSVSQTHW